MNRGFRGDRIAQRERTTRLLLQVGSRGMRDGGDRQRAQLAEDLIAWMQALSLTGKHRTAEPKRLRLCLFTVAGRLIRTARRLQVRLDRNWPWAHDINAAMQRLHALAPG